MNNKIFKREGRITPKYKGYFVSFWKKVDGKNTPYSLDEVDELYVETINGTIKLNKEYLLKNKILQTDTTKGKLGFRIQQADINYIDKN